MNRVSRALSTLRSFFRALEKSRRFHFLRPCSEGRCRAAPAQRFDVLEEGRVAAQRRELLKEKRELPLFAKDVRRKIFNRAVSIQKPGRGFRADARNARIAVGRIADEPEQIRNERRIDPEFFADRRRITNDLPPPVDLHDPRPAYALPEVFVR